MTTLMIERAIKIIKHTQYQKKDMILSANLVVVHNNCIFLCLIGKMWGMIRSNAYVLTIYTVCKFIWTSICMEWLSGLTNPCLYQTLLCAV